MKTLLLRATTLSFTTIMFAAGCGEAPTGASSEFGAPQLGKGGNKRNPPKEVMVPAWGVFRDSPDDAVRSYGVNLYEAVFREYGNFNMSAYHEDRTFYFDFPDDLDPPLPPPDSTYAAFFATGVPGIRGGIDVYRMDVGNATTTGSFQWNTVEGEGPRAIETGWRLTYGSDCGRIAASDRLLSVTHTDANWTLSGHSAILCRTRQKGEKGKGLLEVGRYEMPFSLTITEQSQEH